MRPLLTAVGLLGLWQLLVLLSGVPKFILPSPLQVAVALVEHRALLFEHMGVTLLEIVAGLLLGALFGIATALQMAWLPRLQRWLMPLLVVSQTIPVFALAPILMLWLGFGIASKIAMTVLIIYFPVTAACYDGLRSTRRGWIDLAQTMGAGRLAELRHVRLPAALPALASGLRVATCVAPIGAVVGEWVGSSSGLGFLMLHANGRMMVDLMFAALFVLCASAVALYFLVDRMLLRALAWQPETLTANPRGRIR